MRTNPIYPLAPFVFSFGVQIRLRNTRSKFARARRIPNFSCTLDSLHSFTPAVNSARGNVAMELLLRLLQKR
jgi:hypothetical protein